MTNVEDRRALAREIAQKGAVLLKNDGLLPLGKGAKVAVFGRTQVDTIKGGTGSANCDCEYTVSILDGMIEAGICVDTALAARYRTWTAAHSLASYGVWGSGMHSNPEMPVSEVFSEPIDAEIAVIVLGRTAGENEDVTLSDGDWYLSREERELFRAVTERFPGKTAVLLNSGGVMDFSFLETYGISALLHVFMPGMEGARAVGDLLTGKATPSGKLTVTVPYAYEDCPTAGRFGQTGGGILQDYTEDIFVGYRYYLSFEKAAARVRYPFGFGLSYTVFDLDDYTLFRSGDMCRVTVRVENRGSLPGAETVQVYVAPPQPKDGAKLFKPARQLVGFCKTRVLAPGEAETVGVTFDVSRIASFDDTGATGHKNAWVLEAGTYTVFAGTDSTCRTRAGTFAEKTLRVLEHCHAIGTELPERLRGDGNTEALETLPADPVRGIRIAAVGKTRVDADLFASAEGNCRTYHLLAGATGGYLLTFEGVDAKDMRIELDGAEPSDYRGEVLLPAGLTKLTVCAKNGGAWNARALILEKTDPTVRVATEGKTVFSSALYYESSYGVSVFHLADGSSVISNFWCPGKSVVYKLNTPSAGIYDLSFCYLQENVEKPLTDVMAVFVSNVGQPIAPVRVPHTENGFCTTEPVQVALPQGESYLKLVAVSVPFPRIASFTLEKSAQTALFVPSAGEEGKKDAGGYGVSLIDAEPDADTAKILLRDVADGKATMQAFLDQFTAGDLIHAVSGDPRNTNETGVSGCLGAGLRKFGLPALETSDGPLGLRLNGMTTAYPSGSMLASTWDPALAEQFGRAIGDEAQELGIDIWLAPGINLYRDVRCGRAFEYYAEDPVLASAIATHVTRGVQANGTSVCVKHFAVNNTEHERLKSDSRVSARAMRELYLRVFEYTLRDGDPWCVMSSYNHVNGIKVSEQRTLITEIAHGEWGWDGVIVSDWGNDSKHVAEVLAGQDVKMPGGDVPELENALADGTLKREDFYPLAARVARLVMKTRNFREYIK